MWLQKEILFNDTFVVRFQMVNVEQRNVHWYQIDLLIMCANWILLVCPLWCCFEDNLNQYMALFLLAYLYWKFVVYFWYICYHFAHPHRKKWYWLYLVGYRRRHWLLHFHNLTIPLNVALDALFRWAIVISLALIAFHVFPVPDIDSVMVKITNVLPRYISMCDLTDSM